MALVTGASQGIGRAVALRLAAEGAQVALAARKHEKLEAVAAEIAAAGGIAAVFTLDAANEDSIKACAKAVVTHFGKLEILVNNAGITRDVLALRMKRLDWDDVLLTNLTGAFLMSQACMSPMLKAKWGSDDQHHVRRGRVGAKWAGQLCGLEGGLIGLTKSLARELAGRAITVNAIAPGFIETAMTAVLTEEQKLAMTSQVPLGRVGRTPILRALSRFWRRTTPATSPGTRWM